jgi:hypothetical protein
VIVGRVASIGRAVAKVVATSATVGAQSRRARSETARVQSRIGDTSPAKRPSGSTCLRMRSMVASAWLS